MPYTRPYTGGFQDFPDTTTPINATALNTIDVGVKTANDQFQTVTTAQRAALTPTVGQAVWDSDLRQLMVFMNAAGGNAWQPVGNRIVCASTTRPSTPFEGQEIYETDSNQTLVYNGSSWIEVGDLDNTNGVPSGLAPIYARISGGTSQTGIVSGTWTKVNSSGATVTNPSGLTIANGEITIPGATYPGVYAFYGFVQWDSNATDSRFMTVAPASAVSTTYISGTSISAHANCRTTVSGMRIFTSNEAVCLSVLQGSGTNRSLAFDNADFLVARVSPNL